MEKGGEGEPEAVVVLFQSEDRRNILLLKRAMREGDPWSGQICLPGGFIKDGESPEEAAIRESIEEVSLRPKNLQILGIFSPNNKKVKVLAFLSEGEGDPTPDGVEIVKAEWVPINELRDEGVRFVYHDMVVWGMTFRIIKEYLKIRRSR